MDGSEIQFIGIQDYDGQPRVEVRMSTDAVTLDEIFPIFEDFLKGMGFSLRGQHLELIDEEK